MDAGLDRFRRLVLADPALVARLVAEDDPRRLAVKVVALACVEGIDLDLATVEDALAEARHRAWVQW